MPNDMARAIAREKEHGLGDVIHIRDAARGSSPPLSFVRVKIDAPPSARQKLAGRKDVVDLIHRRIRSVPSSPRSERGLTAMSSHPYSDRPRGSLETRGRLHDRNFGRL